MVYCVAEGRNLAKATIGGEMLNYGQRRHEKKETKMDVE